MALDLTRGGGSAGDNARRSGDSRGRKYNQVGGVEVGPVQKVLRGHPKPANEGHLKTGQRE